MNFNSKGGPKPPLLFLSKPDFSNFHIHPELIAGYLDNYIGLQLCLADVLRTSLLSPVTYFLHGSAVSFCFSSGYWA
jgi:hypothetical protein